VVLPGPIREWAGRGRDQSFCALQAATTLATVLGPRERSGYLGVDPYSLSVPSLAVTELRPFVSALGSNQRKRTNTAERVRAGGSDIRLGDVSHSTLVLNLAPGPGWNGIVSACLKLRRQAAGGETPQEERNASIDPRRPRHAFHVEVAHASIARSRRSPGGSAITAWTVIEPRSSGSTNLGPSRPLRCDDLVNPLNLPAREPVLDVQEQPHQRLGDPDRSIGRHRRMNRVRIDDVLMDERDIVQAERIGGHLLIRLVVGGHPTSVAGTSWSKRLTSPAESFDAADAAPVEAAHCSRLGSADPEAITSRQPCPNLGSVDRATSRKSGSTRRGNTSLRLESEFPCPSGTRMGSGSQG
jgi:hypothetical protein